MRLRRVYTGEHTFTNTTFFKELDSAGVPGAPVAPFEELAASPYSWYVTKQGNDEGSPTCTDTYLTYTFESPGIYAVRLEVASKETAGSSIRAWNPPASAVELIQVVSKGSSIEEGGTENDNEWLPVQIKTVSLPNGKVGEEYSGELSAVHGALPYSWTVYNHPPGVTTTSAGVMSGIPTSPGIFAVTPVTVTDGVLDTDTKPLSITILPEDVHISNDSLSSGIVDHRYAELVQAEGGYPPYSFLAENLSPGLTMSISGSITGIPTSPGTSTVSLTVHDRLNTAATKPLDLLINDDQDNPHTAMTLFQGAVFRHVVVGFMELWMPVTGATVSAGGLSCISGFMGAFEFAGMCPVVTSITASGGGIATTVYAINPGRNLGGSYGDIQFHCESA